MPRKVFFSFHYDDIMRVNVVRNSNVVKTQYEPTSRAFFDKSLWEEAKKLGDLAIKRMINEALEGSAVTCVLIGQQTWQRPWVRYEIMKSFERGNGLLGIFINGIRPVEPKNPFAGLLSDPPPSILSGNPFTRAATGSGATRTLLTGDSKQTLGEILAGQSPSPFGKPKPTFGGLLASSPFDVKTEPVEERGPNPFDYLGFYIDQQRQRVVLSEWNGTAWQDYDKCGPMPLAGNAHGLTQYSQGAQLSTLFRSYDWVASKGYQALGAWIEHAAKRSGR